MQAAVSSIMDMFKDIAWFVLWAGCALLIIEIAFPASRYSLYSRVRGYGFWLLNSVFMAVTIQGMALVIAHFGIKPLWTFRPFDMLDGAFGVFQFGELIVAAIAANAVSYFFLYWFHRLQHVVPWLWDFHKVHHAVREMSAINCNHHFSEEMFRAPFIAVPMAFLIGVNAGPTPYIVGAILGIQVLYEHSSTRLHIGFLRYLINDNRYHRIHHSIEERHWNKNFSSYTPIWDIAFGTAYFPSKGEWPETGVEGVKDPSTISEMLFTPFRRRGFEEQQALDRLKSTQPDRSKNAIVYIATLCILLIAPLVWLFS